MTQLDDIKKRYEEACIRQAWEQHGGNFRHGRTIWSGERRLFGNQHECTEAEFDLVLHAPADIGHLLRRVVELEKEIRSAHFEPGASRRIDAAIKRAEVKP